MKQNNPQRTATQLKIQKKILRRSFFWAFLVFCVVFGFSLLGWRISHEALHAMEQSEFERIANELSGKIQRRITAYTGLLDSVRGFFEGSDLVERDEWRTFLKHYVPSSDFPGLIAIRFVERVKGSDKETFIQSVRRDKSVSSGGYPDFDIRPMPGSLGNESTRDEFYVVKYVTPFLGNERMMGWDLFSNAWRRKIHEDAWMTGETIAGVISDDSTLDKGSIILCAPVFSRDLPHSQMLEKHNALAGFIDIIISTSKLFLFNFAEKTPIPKIFFEIYPKDQDEHDILRRNLLYSNYKQEEREKSEETDYEKSRFKTSQTVEIGKRAWTIFFFSNNDFQAEGFAGMMPTIILIAGACLSFLVWGILYVLSTSRLRAVLLAQEITGELKESEQRLRAISESALDAVISINSEKRIIFWNHGAEEIFGYRSDEVFNKDITSVVPFCFLNPPQQHSEKALDDEMSFEGGNTIEMEGIKKGGSEFPIEISIATWGRKGEDFWTIVARDISLRKKVEKIQGVERAVMEIIASAQTTNEGIAEILEFLCKEFNWPIGVFWSADESAELLRFGSFFQGRFKEQTSWLAHQTIAKGTGFAGQAWETGRPVWAQDIILDPAFQDSGVIIPDDLKKGVAFPALNQRQVVGVLTFLGVGSSGHSVHSAKSEEISLDEDLSNLFHVLTQQIGHFVWRERIKEEIQSAQQALSEREKLTIISQLAAGVAHEVKNPLAIVLQGVDFLKTFTKDQDTQVHEVLDGVANAVWRADKIIHGLLELSQPEPLQLQAEDIHAILETSLLLMKNTTDRNSIHIRKQWQQGIPKLLIDKGKIEQVFINLFMNAADAMEPGGIITLKTKQTQNSVIVTVENTGQGIPESMLSKIFSPFVTSKRAKGGSGLGLPVARSIMEMHKGTIQIENTASGVKATVVFPCSSEKSHGGGE